MDDTSSIGRQGWLLDEDLSNDMLKIFHRDGRAAVAFRGTQTGLLAGQAPTLDDVNNVQNAVLGTRRIPNRQTKIINETMKRVIDTYGLPDFYAGHSRGGAEVKIAKATYGGEMPGYVFNSAPSVATTGLSGIKEIRVSTDAVFRRVREGQYDQNPMVLRR